jgi:hypothetical protein
LYEIFGSNAKNFDIQKSASKKLDDVMLTRNADAMQQAKSSLSSHKEMRRDKLKNCKPTFDTFQKIYGGLEDMSCVIPELLKEISDTSSIEGVVTKTSFDNNMEGFIDGEH